MWDAQARTPGLGKKIARVHTNVAFAGLAVSIDLSLCCNERVRSWVATRKILLSTTKKKNIQCTESANDQNSEIGKVATENNRTQNEKDKKKRHQQKQQR